MSGELNQFALLKERRFAPFFITQFLGAFNDNVFRYGLLILIVFQGVEVAGLDPIQLANLAGALFILPFFLFSATAGQVADKFEKSRIIRTVKLFEVALMLCAAFAVLSGAYVALLGMLFLMGCQSTMFGPVKYAYLPQHLETGELIGGNALLESGTYLAIILGMLFGNLAAGTGDGGQGVLAGSLVAIAAAGYLSSLRIPVTPAADPALDVNFNVIRETLSIIGFARRRKSVFLSILGISWFWFYGSALTLQVAPYTLDVLNATETVTALLLVAFIVGVAAGSLLCERLSGGRVELGLVPFGALGLTVFGADLYFAQPAASPTPAADVAEFLSRPGSFRILMDLALLGAFGGIYSVPLYAIVQQRSEPAQLSRIIAANNIINSLFMVVAAGLAIVMIGLGATIPQFFLLVAILNAAVAAYIFGLLPEFLMRFLAWGLTHLFYRIRVTGAEHVPETGAAVVVCNHVSFVDALVIGGAVRRPLRFVMYYRIFDIPLLNFLFRNAKAIPIASAREDPALLEAALDRVAESLEAGDIVCVFPEGAITRDGNVQRFRPGIEHILERTPVPVIPMAVSGLWGSWFSRSRGGLRKLPGRLFARVHVRIASPLAAEEATAERLELIVRSLRGPRR